MPLPLCAVAVIPDHDTVRVVAAGELDLSTAPLLRRELDELIAVGWLAVNVDLRETTFADSSALHVLLDAHDQMETFGGSLSIMAGRGQVADLLHYSCADRPQQSSPHGRLFVIS